MSPGAFLTADRQRGRVVLSNMSDRTQPTNPGTLSTEGTGLNLQVLKGPSNYLRWSRDFQVVAQAKALWEYFSGRAEVIEKPKPSDYGFGGGSVDISDATPVDEDESIKRIKRERKGKARQSLLPSEIQAIKDSGDAKEGSSGQAQAKPTQTTSDASYRLAVFKFELDMYEKFQKQMSMAMALLVAWVDPSIRGRLQSFEDPYVAYSWLKIQYSLTPVRALELAQNNFERLRLSSCNGMQSYINEVEIARLDIEQAGGTCTDDTVVSKLIRGLNGDYDAFVDQYHFFRDTSDAKYDLPTMTHRLLTFESDLIQRKQNRRTIRQVAIPRSCDTCGKMGHTSDRCWQTHPEMKLSPEEFRARRAQYSRTQPDRKNTDSNNSKVDNKSRRILAMTTTDLKAFNQKFNANSTKTTCESSMISLKPQANVPPHSGPDMSLRGSDSDDEHVSVARGLVDRNEDDRVEKGSTCMLISQLEQYERNKWIIDSGANTHAVNDLKWFVDYCSFQLEIATAGDEKSLWIQGGGTALPTVLLPNGRTIELQLSRVAYCPDLRCNIISLSQLARLGNLRGDWNDGKLNVSTAEGEIVISAVEKEGLYTVQCRQPDSSKTKRLEPDSAAVPLGVVPPMVVANVDFNDPVWKWHRRLGHLGVENMRRLLKVSDGMNVTDKQIREKLGSICPVCATTKAILRIPRDPATRRFKNKGDLVHVDSWGPYPVKGIGGIKHFVALTDDATRYTWTERYRSREEVAGITIDLLKKIQRAENMLIRRIRTDNEFIHTEVKAFCAEKGITLEYTAPRSAFQNGVAERQFRTEREKTATMIQEHILPDRIAGIIRGHAEEMLRNSTAPEMLWPEAWQHAVWLKNRAPTRALKDRKTPYEALTGHRPNLERERVWGSRTYVTISPEDPARSHKPKLTTPRAWMGYFVGCESESMYCIWNPDTNKVRRVPTARVDDGEGLDDTQTQPDRSTRLPNEKSVETYEGAATSESESNASESGIGDDDDIIQQTTSDVDPETAGNARVENQDQTHSDTSSSNSQHPTSTRDTGTKSRFFAPLEINMPKVSPTKVECPKCKRTFFPKYINRHMKTCRGQIERKGETVVCDICHQEKGKSGIAAHRRRCAGKVKTCKVCSQEYPSMGFASHEKNCDGSIAEGDYKTCIKCKEKILLKNFTIHKIRCGNEGEGTRRTDPFYGRDSKDKCLRCFNTKVYCDGEAPFESRCSNCVKGGPGTVCRPQNWKKSDDICNRCSQNKAITKAGIWRCDGGRPCKRCINNKWLCCYDDADATRQYVTNPDKMHDDENHLAEEGDIRSCHECIWHAKNSIARNQCDGGFPCNRCTEGKGTSGRLYCSYYGPNGEITKVELKEGFADRNRSSRRNAHELYHNKERSMRMKKARRKIVESQDIDSEEDNSDVDDLLLNPDHSKHQETFEQQEQDELNENRTDDEEEDKDEENDNSDASSEYGSARSDDDDDDDDSNGGPDDDDGGSGNNQDQNDQDDDRDPSEPLPEHFDPSDYGDGAGHEMIGGDLSGIELDQGDPDSGGESDKHRSNPIDKNTTFDNMWVELSDETYDSISNEEESLSDEKLMRKTMSEEEEDAYLEALLEKYPDPRTWNTSNGGSCTVCVAEMALDPDPSTRRQALQRPDADKWQAAMQDEYDSLIRNQTWQVVDRPRLQHVLSNRWVLRRKLGSNGEVKRYKARFVVRGFEQIHGIDFDETFAGVIKQPSYKILFALQAYFKWQCHQMDVKTAFLHGDVEEEVYIEPPEGFPELLGKVLKLNKALYGLKQASRQWYIRLKNTLIKYGWIASTFDNSLFIHPSGLYLTVYVDDINIFGSNTKAIEATKVALRNAFEMTDLGQCAYYLGMHIQNTPEGIYLHQASYVQQILNKFQFGDINPVSTPVDSLTRLTLNRNETARRDFIRMYQAMVGSLNYLATVSRPDIAFAVGLLARYMSNPSAEHMKAIRRVFAYVKATKHLGLYFSRGRTKLQGWCDSDWGTCTDTARSTSGWIFTLGGSPISWSSKRQKTVALSTCEAEYMAATEATKEAIWLQGLLREMGVQDIGIDQPTSILIDNNSAMKLSRNPEFHARTKHIAMRHHFLREQVTTGNIKLHRVGTKDNVADMFTKPLPRPRFVELTGRMGLKTSPEEIETLR